jgi:hypothetical protein
MNKTNRRFDNESFARTKNRGRVAYQPDRGARVAKIAYKKAKDKAVSPGQKLDDWLEEEQELSF